MEDKLITIAIHTYSRAQLLKGRLEAGGIECSLKNVNLVHSAVPGGVKVNIKSKDLKKALRIVEKVNEEYQNQQDSEENTRSDAKILVPVDFSDYSVNACKYAIGIAEKLNAEIKLLHVYYNPLLNSMPLTDTYYYQVNMDEIMRDMELNAKESMEEFYNDLKSKIERDKIQGIKLDYELVRGLAADEIIMTSREYNPDVVIIGMRGKGERENDLIGSVAAHVIEDTRVPVLVIPEASIYEGVNTINILYATDFDDSDYFALKKLMNILAPFSIRLNCVHIGSDRSNTWDKVKMDHFKKQIKKQYPDYEIKCDIMNNEDIETGLQEYIRNHNIDILSMVTHKRNIIAKVFQPSFAKKMLYHTNIPMLIFHSKD